MNFLKVHIWLSMAVSVPVHVNIDKVLLLSSALVKAIIASRSQPLTGNSRFLFYSLKSTVTNPVTKILTRSISVVSSN